MAVKGIRSQARNTLGVRVIRLDEGDEVRDAVVLPVADEATAADAPPGRSDPPADEPPDAMDDASELPPDEATELPADGASESDPTEEEDDDAPPAEG
jgi:hypothetical protein